MHGIIRSSNRGRVAGSTLLAWAFLVSIGQAADRNLTLQNECLRITVDDAGGFTLRALPVTSGKGASGRLEGASGSPTRVKVNDATFGEGEALVWPTGRIMVFPK